MRAARTRRAWSVAILTSLVAGVGVAQSLPARADHGPDLSVSTVVAPASRVVPASTEDPPGGTARSDITYTMTVANLGHAASGTTTFATGVPTDTTFQSFNHPAGNGWVCTTPALGQTGNVSCTRTSVPTSGTGSSTPFTLVVRVDSDVASGTVINHTASVTPTDANPGNNTATASVTVQTADLGITMTGAPSQATAGATNVTYTITATNAGDTAAVNATLKDTVSTSFAYQSLTAPSGWACTTPLGGASGDVTCTRPSFAAGATAEFSLVLRVRPSAAAGTPSNTAELKSDTPDPTIDSNNTNTASVSTTVTTSADVAVTVTHAPEPVAAGSDLTYTIVVRNLGPSDAASVTLDNPIPAHTTFRSITPAGCTAPPVDTTGAVHCSVGTLVAPTPAVASEKTYTLVVRVAPGTPGGTLVRDTAQVASTTPDPVSNNNSDSEDATVVAPSDVSLTLAGSPSTVAKGKTITYTITVANSNGGTVAQNVELTDDIPVNTTYASHTTPADWECELVPTPTPKLECNVAELAAGASAVVTLVVTVGDVPSNTTIANTATVTANGDPDSSNNSRQVTTTVQSADLSVAVTDSPDAVVAGSDLTYTITMTNSGDAAASSARMTMATPSGTTFKSVTFTSGQSWTCSNPGVGNAGMVTCTISSMPAAGSGATASFTVKVVPDPALPANTVITASPSVTSNTPDPDTSDDSATTTTTTSYNADVAVTMTASPNNFVGTGDDITYTVTVTNGPSTAQNVTLVIGESSPANTSYRSLSAPAGWSCVPNRTQGDTSTTFTCTIATLPPTTGEVFTLVARVQPGTASNTQLNRTATVSATTHEATANPNSASVLNITVRPADLATTMSGPTSAAAGTDVTYTVGVTNHGPQAATKASVAVALSPDMTFQSVTKPANWSCSGTATVTCTYNTSMGLGSATFTVVARVHSGVPSGTALTSTATASSPVTDDDLSDNAASSTATSTTEADLGITDAATPDPVGAGSDITYAMVVTNHGPSDAIGASSAGPTLTSSTPASTTFRSLVAPAGWTCTKPAVGGTGAVTCLKDAAMVAGTSGSFTLLVRVNAGTASATTINHTASVSSSTPEPSTDPHSNSASATTTVETADLTVTNTDSSSPDPVTAGTNLTYTLEVANDGGPSAADNVELTDQLPARTTFVSLAAPDGWACTTPPVGATGEVSCTIPTLAVDATALFSLVVKVKADTPSGTSISNTASVTSDTPDSDTSDNSATTTTATDTAADLGVTNADAPDPVVAGSNLTYTIGLTNNGPSNAAEATITSAVPANTTFQSVAFPAEPSPGWICTAPAMGGTGTVTCSRASMAPGTATFTVVVKVDPATPSGTTITDTATASTTTDDSVPGNDSATATTTTSASADLAVAMSDSPDPVGAGSDLTYAITVTNNGPSNAATANLGDTLPPNTTFQSLAKPAAWTCTTPAVGAGGAVSCTNSSLAPSVSTFSLTVRVNPGTASGTILSNTANVNSATTDPSSSNNSASTTTSVQTADMVVTVADAPDPAAAGTNVTYTIGVTNDGPSNVVNPEVANAVPANTTFQSLGAVPAGWSCTTPAAGATGTIECTRGLFAPGTASFSVTVRVNPGTASGTTITDTATVDSDTPDPTPANNRATTTTTVQTAGLAVTVSDSPDPVRAGGDIVYSITATNNGDAPASSVSLTDTLPSGVAFRELSSPAGWTCATPAVGSGGTITCTKASLAAGSVNAAFFTLTARVGPGTADGETLSNTATVSSTTPDPSTSDNSATATTTVSAVADLVVGIADSPDPVGAGDTVTYTVALANKGPSDAATTTVALAIPANTTFESFAPPSGWTCAAPAAGGTGSVTCTRPSLPAGAFVAFPVVVRTSAGSAGSTVTATDAISSATSDPSTGDNTASTTTKVLKGSGGYSLVAADGGMFTFGDAGFFGSAGGMKLNSPIVGMAATPTGKGYWLVAADGGVLSFGDALFHGSTGGLTLNSPIVGMAATPTGNGYWLAAADGGIFAFGDARFHGSTGGLTLNSPIVGVAATPTGNGYRFVAADGGVFNFGDAAFHGSTGGVALNSPIVGMAAMPTGKGYWLVAADGGMFAFGDAGFFGSMGGQALNSPIVGMASTATGRGYRLVARDGGIFAFGNATFKGSTGGVKLNSPIVGMA